MVEGNVEGPVYRVGPPHEGHGVIAPYTGGDVLFGARLVRHVLAERYRQGARYLVQPASRPVPADCETLFVVWADGRLVPVTEASAGAAAAAGDDLLVLLGPVPPTQPRPGPG